LIDNSVYAENKTQDYIYYAYGPLIQGTGVCEGYAEAARLLFDAVGIESVFVSGTVDDNIPHAWNIVNIGGNWYQLDITWDDPITSSGNDVRTYDYFNITDTEMAQDHVWSGNYPLCTTTDRGIGATEAADRPQSQEESSEPSVIASSAVQVSSLEITQSSQPVSSKSSSAASQPLSSRTSLIQSESSASVSSSETATVSVTPVFSAATPAPSSEQTGFQPSAIISALSHNLGLSVPMVTALLSVAAAALLLIIAALIFRKK